MYSFILTQGLCILNSAQPTRINHPPLNNSVVEITVVSLDLQWDLNWMVLGNPNSSDHYPIIISSTSTTSPCLGKQSMPKTQSI